MNLRRALLAFSFLLLAAGRLSAVYVWFTSAPSPVESGQGYYVEAYAFSYNEGGVSLSLYKNWGWFASGGGWSDAVAGGWTSDGGPQTVDYLAEAYDPYEGGAWAQASVNVNGTPPPANSPPNAWVEVDGHGHTATVVRPYGGTVAITVRYKAGDPDGNLARIRPQVWHPATGLFTNDGGGWTGQGGGYGEVVRTITLDRDGDWYFWTDAEDTNNVFVNSGAWGDAFRLNVVQGAPPNSPPVITLTSPAAQTITVGTALTISSHATDANGNLTHHHLDIQRPDGAWNWQGGFANGEPYNGGPVGSAADSTRTAAFTFDQAGTWQVRSWANDSNGANLHSATVAITVNPVAAPGAPQNLQVSGLTSSSFALSWTNPGGATGYEVRLNGDTPVAVSGLSYTFTGLAAGASYSAEVRAVGAGGMSGWVGAGATTGGSGGGPVAAQSLWRDIDGDGILDEIVQPNTVGFDYYVNTWYTQNIIYASYPINNFWLDWTAVIDGANFFNYLSSLWSGAIFWYEFETHFDLMLSLLAQAGEPIAIYRDTSGSHEINPATWGAPIFNLPNGFPTAGTQYLNWPLPGPNDLPGVQYFLVKKGLPVGSLQLSDTSGNVLVNNVATGGTVDLFLPANGQVVFNAMDTIGRLIGTATDLTWKILDAAGNVIQDWTSGNSITVGAIDSDALVIHVKRGLIFAGIFTARPIKPILEPITTSGGVPPRNPSGFEVGTQATFELSLNFGTGVSDNDIVWTSSGGVTFLNGNNRGRSVTVIGTAAGPASFEVQVGGFAGPKPTVTTNVFVKNIVPFRAYVVRNNTGGSAAATQTQITSMINRANLIYKQTAMEFVQQGAINYIDNVDHLVIQAAGDAISDYAEGRTLTSMASGTGGLEVYFVSELEGLPVGLHYGTSGAAAGLIVEGTAPENTLAHELGHACGLDDIYAELPGTTLPSDKVKQAWLPSDWNNGPGPAYYSSGLRQIDLIIGRLLMHGTGTGVGSAVVIARGSVHGVKANATTGLVNVGLGGMNRNPQHP